MAQNKFSLTSYAVGIAVGSFIGNNSFGLFWETEPEKADKRVAIVQTHNEQLSDQLSGDFSMDSLVLDDKGKTYSFTTSKGNGGMETCIGTYKLQNDAAVAIGTIACTNIEELAE